EGLRDLPIRTARDQAGVAALHRRPDLRLTQMGPKQAPHLVLDLVHDLAVEVQPVGRIIERALPVAAVEAASRAARDLRETLAVTLEAVQDGGRGRAGVLTRAPGRGERHPVIFPYPLDDRVQFVTISRVPPGQIRTGGQDG